MHTYITHGTCSRKILFDVTPENTLTNVSFVGGCPGNLKALSKLVEGKPIDYVINTLKGIPCRGNTSCSDQLARALEEYKSNMNSMNK